jgi:hypothetical protein
LTPFLPYAIAGGMVSRRLSPTRMPSTPTSHPSCQGRGSARTHTLRRSGSQHSGLIHSPHTSATFEAACTRLGDSHFTSPERHRQHHLSKRAGEP